MAEEKAPQQEAAPQKPASPLRQAIQHEAEDLGLDQVNFVKEALRWQYNWIGLAGAALFALLSGTGLPLVLAAGLEMIYLSVVPQINRKRIEILTKRLEKYDKVRENQNVIKAQCSALEDVLQLIRDQSVTMRDPQQVSDQLESLVHEVEQTEETVRQVEDIFELATPDVDESLAALAGDSSADSGPV